MVYFCLYIYLHPWNDICKVGRLYLVDICVGLMQDVGLQCIDLVHIQRIEGRYFSDISFYYKCTMIILQTLNQINCKRQNCEVQWKSLRKLKQDVES